MLTDSVLDYEEVMRRGKKVDLDGIVYRRGQTDITPGYYDFLAGLVDVTGAERILEIGTWHGGSTMAMSRALGARGQVLTIDVEWHNDESLREIPPIKRIHADSLAPRTRGQLRHWFGDEPLDILYVDSGHDDRQTFENVALYGNLLRPLYIVVDDIRLNESMRRAWARLVALHPGRCSDVSDLVDRSKVGFGIIECEYPFAWPEMSRARLAAWRAYWILGRTLMPRLPARTAHAIRRLVRGQHLR